MSSIVPGTTGTFTIGKFTKKYTITAFDEDFKDWTVEVGNVAIGNQHIATCATTRAGHQSDNQSWI